MASLKDLAYIVSKKKPLKFFFATVSWKKGQTLNYHYMEPYLCESK